LRQLSEPEIAQNQLNYKMVAPLPTQTGIPSVVIEDMAIDSDMS